MKVILTGGSSFTGMWFAESLAARGAEVVAPLRRAVADYEGVRALRVARLRKIARVVENCVFGSNEFLGLTAEGADILCHHAAEATDYKSPAFDAAAALAANTKNLPRILEGMPGLRAVVLTGSVFEADEGAGTEPREAFSPYGLSKTLTAQAFRFWCGKAGLPLVKFVIANPFGPFEEPRFFAYLMKCWAQGRIAEVKTPDYVRDNVPVSLLAGIYGDCVLRAAEGEAAMHVAPSFYAETQGMFAQRAAREMAARLGWKCELALLPQSDFSEPMARVNKDKIALTGWDEEVAWDSVAEYYRAIAEAAA